MKSNFKVAAAAAFTVLSLGMAPTAAAARIVFDPTQSAHAIEQIRQYAHQLKQLKAQLENQKEMLKNMTFETAYDMVAGDEFKQLLVPAEWSQIYQTFKGDNWKEVTSAKKFDPSDTEKTITRQLEILEAAMKDAESNIKATEALFSKLSQTKNEKDAIDLQNRIAIQSAKVQNQMQQLNRLGDLEKIEAKIQEARSLNAWKYGTRN